MGTRPLARLNTWNTSPPGAMRATRGMNGKPDVSPFLGARAGAESPRRLVVDGTSVELTQHGVLRAERLPGEASGVAVVGFRLAVGVAAVAVQSAPVRHR